MFVRNGAVTPGPSRECDITFFVKGRPKSARQSRDRLSTVAARRVQSVTVPSSRVSRECCSPGLRCPPLKNARFSRSLRVLRRRRDNLDEFFKVDLGELHFLCAERVRLFHCTVSLSTPAEQMLGVVIEEVLLWNLVRYSEEAEKEVD